MSTFVLNAETASLSIGHLLNQVGKGGLEVRDDHGNIVAFVISPGDHEALTYAEAQVDLNENTDQVRQALGRLDGITTSQLLEKAAALSDNKAGN